MRQEIPEKVREQIRNARLPTAGDSPFRPKLSRNLRGDTIIEKAVVKHGPKRGKRGFVDAEGHTWVRDYAHGGMPDHWDVQVDDVQVEEGRDYFRVDEEGSIMG